MKKALITGILGQDGSYLAEYLLSIGYEVHGIVRGLSVIAPNYVRGVTYYIGDMRDELSLENAFRKIWPDEIYNLAGQVFVPTSWTQPEDTFNVNTGGLTRLIRIVERLKKDTKIYQASSSEMYGNIGGTMNEYSVMKPVSPYGISKLASHKLVEVYRNAGFYVVGGILFNHESPRRGEHMVTRKITKQVAKWALGDRDILELGNLQASRDWGHAKDYVRGMWMMMQQEKPDDFVLGTGETHTVGNFLQASVRAAGMKWGDVKSLVRANAKSFVRQGELHYLKADASKAKIILGWEPEVTFDGLVKEMVKADIESEQKRMQLELAPREFRRLAEKSSDR